jgi:hypothetical protein
MVQKPHRILIDRVSGYADEAAAFMRRRRMTRRPFARIYYSGGRSIDHAAETDAGQALFLSAARLVELARLTDVHPDDEPRDPITIEADAVLDPDEVREGTSPIEIDHE